MPLPHEKKFDIHRAHVNGRLEVGTQKSVKNENMRVIGTTFTPLFSRSIPFTRYTLTSTDQSLLGATFQQIKMKVSITYNKQIETQAESKLLVKIGKSMYSIEKTDKWQNELILYLVTADEKGGKVHGY